MQPPLSEYGNALAVVANGPDDEIDEDRLDLVHRMLRVNWEKTAEINGLVWAQEPEVLVAPSPFNPTGKPQAVTLYDEYDDEGNGIGDPAGYRYQWTYGWRARGYKS